jgi:Protein of unknown function (DUF3109)
MIAIDNKLISDEIIEEKFVCDLSKCKGGCCEDGDAGAPLENEEKNFVQQYYPMIKEYMTSAGIKIVEEKGFFEYDRSFGWVTPTIDGGLCVYGKKDKKGWIVCGFEKAYNEGKIPWKKPISCHLFPIKLTKSRKEPVTEYINYMPRETLCSPACALGEKLKVPVYQFLKEPLIRKYGQEFYDTLDATATYIKDKINNNE